MYIYEQSNTYYVKLLHATFTGEQTFFLSIIPLHPDIPDHLSFLMCISLKRKFAWFVTYRETSEKVPCSFLREFRFTFRLGMDLEHLNF